MSAHDKAAKARARMDQVSREMAERRALRARKGKAAHERARDSLLKQGPVAAQVAKHLGELGRRRRQAGGWATEKTDRDKDYIMGFGGEEERDKFAYRAAPRPQTAPPPGGIGVLDEDEVEPERPTPPAPEAPAARQPRHRAPVRTEIDDEDDFSNQSTWMRNQ